MNVKKALYSDGLDGVEALIELEQIFDLEVNDEIANSMHNVGQLSDFINNTLSENGGKKCITSMSFYKLKKNFNIISPNLDIKPTTQLNHISSKNPKSLWVQLQQVSALNLPQLENTIIGKVALYVGLLSLCALGVMLYINPSSVIIFSLILIVFLSILLFKSDPMRFPKNLQNIGNLTIESSSLNYGKFVKEGARFDKNVTWNILTQVLAGYSEPLEKEQIIRSTPFY